MATPVLPKALLKTADKGQPATRREVDPGLCYCGLPRPSCGDCGMGYQQRLDTRPEEASHARRREVPFGYGGGATEEADKSAYPVSSDEETLDVDSASSKIYWNMSAETSVTSKHV